MNFYKHFCVYVYRQYWETEGNAIYKIMDISVDWNEEIGYGSVHFWFGIILYILGFCRTPIWQEVCHFEMAIYI